MFKKFWHWLHDEEGWKALSGLVYLGICIFDFVIVPSWIGVMRKEITGDILTGMASLDPSVQVALIQSLTVQHQPFTLQVVCSFLCQETVVWIHTYLLLRLESSPQIATAVPPPAPM